MFMQIAIGAIGVGIVVMVGFLIIAQVRVALPVTIRNPCFGIVNDTEACNVSTHPKYAGTNDSVTIIDNRTAEGILGVQTTVFAGFALIAVGIIVLAAFGLINVFK